MFSRKSRGLRSPRIVVQADSVGADLNDYADFTVSGYGAPSAAIVLLSSANTVTNPYTGAVGLYSIGFWDGVDQACDQIGIYTPVTNGARYRRNLIATGYLKDYVVAEWTLSEITDGIRITMTLDNTGGVRYFVVILFWDVEAKLYKEAFEDTTERTYTPGFHPALVFNSLIGSGVSDSTALGMLGFGISHVSSDYSITQYAANFGIENGNPSVVNQGIDADKIGNFYYGDGTDQYTLSVKAATATSFTIEASITNSNIYNFLVIGLEHPELVKLAAYDTKSSSGTQTYTGVGFRPTSLITFNTGMTALNSWPTSANGCLGIAAATGVGEEASQCMSLTDNVSTWSQSHRYDVAALLGVNGSHSVLFNATLDSFDSDGFTLNYNSSSGTYKFIALSIG